jgi:hypothetical protein
MRDAGYRMQDARATMTTAISINAFIFQSNFQAPISKSQSKSKSKSKQISKQTWVKFHKYNVDNVVIIDEAGSCSTEQSREKTIKRGRQGPHHEGDGDTVVTGPMRI